MNDPKIWWQSKTMWVNLLSVVGIVVQGVTGEHVEILTAEGQTALLAVINIVLRSVTSAPVSISR